MADFLNSKYASTLATQIYDGGIVLNELENTMTFAAAKIPSRESGLNFIKRTTLLGYMVQKLANVRLMLVIMPTAVPCTTRFRQSLF